MLKTKLSYLANKFQAYLFPIVEEFLKEETLLQKHYQIIKTLDLLKVEVFFPEAEYKSRGRPSKHRLNIARSFIAKHILNLKTTSQLIHYLKVDKNLRYICGWEPYQSLPNESTFSRVFALIADSNILDKIHETLSKDIFEGHCILHNGRDSVAVPSREWPLDKEGRKTNGKRKRDKAKKKYRVKKETVSQKQAKEDSSLKQMLNELPKKCDIGKKVNSSGRAYCWRGYKLHMDVAEGKFPLSCILTSASIHDTQAAIPLSKMSSERAHVLYELMDSGYDSLAIRDYIKEKGRVPLIKDRIWRGKRGEETKRELKAQRTLSWKPAEGKRLEHRMANERLFSRLKDHFAGMNIWVRGYQKVKCHIMLAVLCLAADELFRQLC